MNPSPSTQSTHFQLHPLAEGVFAAVATNGGSAICNAGIIDLGVQVLVYDTLSELDQLKVPARYARWQLPRFYRANIGFMCDRLRPAQG